MHHVKYHYSSAKKKNLGFNFVKSHETLYAQHPYFLAETISDIT